MTAVPAPFRADLAEGPEGGRAEWLRSRDGRRIRIGEPGWEQVSQSVIARAAVHAHRRAFTLAGRAERLLAASGTLRTRDAEAGLALILGDDCVAPWRMAVDGRSRSGKRHAFGSGCAPLLPEPPCERRLEAADAPPDFSPLWAVR